MALSPLIRYSCWSHIATKMLAGAVTSNTGPAVNTPIPSWSMSTLEARLSADVSSLTEKAKTLDSLSLQKLNGFHSVQPSLVQLSGRQRRDVEDSTSNVLLELSSSFDLLSVVDQAVRLPSFVPKAPVMIPTAVPLTSLDLPCTNDAVNNVVEPYEDLLPRILPSAQSVDKMECINMVRMRRKKMKKHKRIKERKRNRVSHEHRILMDIIRREKIFMLEQTNRLNEVEQFSAEQYVADKIKSYRRPIPKYWNGKRLPESVVIDLMRKQGLPVPGLDD
ncbi:uncharacterized protein LOC108674043 [Hyalella azteca]|uniref:Uncharacterized protein LOC108674043 n=1 Tax=Hyalella azteca TaxID=294128 RepID=A0A8B7NUP3_HYAAZ|nr:uncharacterized protein LOC108674043 [Hyalella azteca]